MDNFAGEFSYLKEFMRWGENEIFQNMNSDLTI